LRTIIRDSGLTVDEFVDLLWDVRIIAFELDNSINSMKIRLVALFPESKIYQIKTKNAPKIDCKRQNLSWVLYAYRK
jgi:hypothetical protein